MSIQELSQKFKGYRTRTDVLLSVLIVVTSLVSFYLGRYSVDSKEVLHDTSFHMSATEQLATPSVVKQELSSPDDTAASSQVQGAAGGYVASKNGTKYHLPWCGGAKQIKEENKIWFATKEDAERAGYSPAANCKGM